MALLADAPGSGPPPVDNSQITDSNIMVCFYNTELESRPFTTTWMGPESIRISEISQTEKDKYHLSILICGI